jgi:hypothetical protein
VWRFSCVRHGFGRQDRSAPFTSVIGTLVKSTSSRQRALMADPTNGSLPSAIPSRHPGARAGGKAARQRRPGDARPRRDGLPGVDPLRPARRVAPRDLRPARSHGTDLAGPRLLAVAPEPRTRALMRLFRSLRGSTWSERDLRDESQPVHNRAGRSRLQISFRRAFWGWSARFRMNSNSGPR